MSAGETPDILEARAIVPGEYFFNFWRHSIERPETLSKSKPEGIVKFSRRIILSAILCSLSIYPLYFMDISVASINSSV